MYLALCAELLLGVLAVFGLYTLLRGLWSDPVLCVTLELTAEATAAEVPQLLEQTRERCLLGRAQIVALLPETQRKNSALLEALRASDVKIYFILP